MDTSCSEYNDLLCLQNVAKLYSHPALEPLNNSTNIRIVFHYWLSLALNQFIGANGAIIPVYKERFSQKII